MINPELRQKTFYDAFSAAFDQKYFSTQFTF